MNYYLVSLLPYNFNTAHADNAVCLVADEQERVLVKYSCRVLRCRPLSFLTSFPAQITHGQIHARTLTETDSLIVMRPWTSWTVTFTYASNPDGYIDLSLGTINIWTRQLKLALTAG
jgi:hypothetical protein